MKHLGLFEGIGGFSLAARWMGWETLAWCEWNEFGQRVLRYHFPKAEGFGDITKIDFTKYANKIDIVTGGFPCQPFSNAGKRKGTEDERYLWGEMLRTIREIQPIYVVGENVRGLTNWNGGLVFDKVQSDLENEGFEVLPFLLPACAVNTPHRRDRIWFVAYSNTASIRRKGWQHQNAGWEKGQKGDFKELHHPPQCKINFNEQNIFSRPQFLRGDNGLPGKLDKHNGERIKALGNAIVPQVAFEIFKAIQKIDSLTPNARK